MGAMENFIGRKGIQTELNSLKAMVVCKNTGCSFKKIDVSNCPESTSFRQCFRTQPKLKAFQK